jgi:hypothetical protein
MVKRADLYPFAAQEERRQRLTPKRVPHLSEVLTKTVGNCEADAGGQTFYEGREDSLSLTAQHEASPFIFEANTFIFDLEVIVMVGNLPLMRAQGKEGVNTNPASKTVVPTECFQKKIMLSFTPFSHHRAAPVNSKTRANGQRKV